MPQATGSVGFIFKGIHEISQRFCLVLDFFFLYELFIVGTETGDVKPVLTVKTEKDDMSCTSYHEGSDELRYWKMSPKQEDVTRGWWFTKDRLELF